MTTLSPAWLNWPETQTLIAAFSGKELRFVGGCVRDALLMREAQDVDAATTLPPTDALALLRAAQIKAIPTGIEHGTVTAVIGGRHFEITTLRKDVATDGRRAQVRYTDDWKEDASRRDFTMNALYLSPSGELFDYFAGETDARAGRVCFIGEAATRIAEDYLRILRFFRFHAHYGKGEPDARGLAACAAAAPYIKALSGERIRQEMLKLLAAPAPYEALRLMQEHGVLTQLLDCAAIGATQYIPDIEAASGRKLDVSARLALLLPDEAAIEKLETRWKLSNELRDRIHTLLQAEIKAAMAPAEQKALLRHMGKDAFSQRVLMAWTQEADIRAGAPAYLAMLQLAESWHIPVFPLGGNDLKALGMKEGKKMGELLAKLELEWELGDYRLTKDELAAKAISLLPHQ